MWGVVDAKWVKPDGTPQSDPLGQGILPKFGVNTTRNGATVLAISSGMARAPERSRLQNVQRLLDKSYSCGTPAGYPKESPSAPARAACSAASDGANDGAALQVKIRVPSNAKSFKYQQNFFTYEFPKFIC